MVAQTDTALLKLKLCLLLRRRRRLRKENKRIWVREIITYRQVFGEYHHLIRHMRDLDPVWHFKYIRMTKERYAELLQLVKPRLEKNDTNYRKCISADERLCATLRFLVTGDAQQTIAMNYRIGQSTMSGIIRETLNALWEVLSPQFLKTPTERTWMAIAKDFESKWNFPHCLGAIDGKHCVIQAPKLTGSDYLNYKKTFSIILLAACDAHYRFTIVDIGEKGRFSDGGVFSTSEFGIRLENGELSIPAPSHLPNSNFVMPYVFVADEAFPLKPNIMRPFPGSQLTIGSACTTID